MRAPSVMEREGARYWAHLHTRAILWYPACASPERQRREEQFLRDFYAALPCQQVCARHAAEYHAQHPPALQGSDAYQLWIFNFHNDVNRRLGKPQFTWAQYRDYYSVELALREKHGV